MGVAWELLHELVRIDSSDPGAYEDEIERSIKGIVEQAVSVLPVDLAQHVAIEELEVLPGRRNLMVTVQGTDDESRLAYICHMDTVTLGDGWSSDIDPLGALERDGVLYGRGACDMKGGLACALSALFSLLDAIAEHGTLPRRGFSLICTVDEEDQMRGAEAAIEAGWVGVDEWVLDTEPTDGQIQVAHKGRTWFELTMNGVTAHASQPWQGADAIAAMAEAICSIRREFNELPAHDELGPSTVTFGQIEGGYQPYVVPDTCTVWSAYRHAGGARHRRARHRPRGGGCTRLHGQLRDHRRPPGHRARPGIALGRRAPARIGRHVRHARGGRLLHRLYRHRRHRGALRQPDLCLVRPGFARARAQARRARSARGYRTRRARAHPPARSGALVAASS